MRKILLLFIMLFIGGLIGYFVFYTQNPAFQKLNAEAMHDRIVKERDYAIGKAVMEGNYRCCISPPCTMCYAEANKWNNFTAGTCACDDLIAEGKEACPQCERGLNEIHGDDNTFCDIDAKISTCN